MESGGVSNVWVSFNGLCITLVIVGVMHYYGFCINTPPPRLPGSLAMMAVTGHYGKVTGR